ncbi:MAG: Rid family hydrolase [Candidatus Thermoplasmatota archaeon]|nr:Rid family hydrolase [Candidatus Thermoplasmatota archaeon]
MGSQRRDQGVGTLSDDPVLFGLYVPPHPHPLLAPDQNKGWGELRAAYDECRKRIEESEADVIIVYSTTWPSIVGHQFQVQPEPEWVHVDDDFHFLGSMPYKFRMDAEFGNQYRDAAEARGLHARTVAYHGFPIDTGSVVALSLLNPDNRIPACIVSSNMYSNRAETIVLGKAARDALKAQGKKAVIVAVSTLSNRMFTKHVEPQDDRIHSAKDEEWNRKILEFFADGRLEDLSQLSRDIHGQIRVQKVVAYKPAWWMAATMGQHNNYDGEVLAYAALHGSGGAVIQLTPSKGSFGDKEFDEDDVEIYRGDRNVLETSAGDMQAPGGVDGPLDEAERPTVEGAIVAKNAPGAVGAYPHARRMGDLLFISGVGPRSPVDNSIPGGPIEDKNGKSLDYDIKAQTEACIENIRVVLEACNAKLSDVIDVTTFLVDMKRDFEGYNKIYAKHFEEIQATRTTLAIQALPTPIAVEMKVIAKAP